MKCIDELPVEELKGKRVLLRSDFNVPLNAEGEVANVFRLQQGWKTVQYLSKSGAKVIVVSHMGKTENSLEPVARALKQFGAVVFIPDVVGAIAKHAVASMQNGEIALLENLRRDEREKANDEGFAKELASLADIYVDDAFAAVHRAHASIVSVPRFLPHYCGFLLRDEITQLLRARKPESPSIAILGGAKFETKAPLIKLLLERYDHVFITGALANDVFKARGLPTGRSLISKEQPSTDILSNQRFIAPVDVTVERADKQARVKKPEEVQVDDKIVDIGPATVDMLAPYLAGAKFIMWNGPTGIFEEGYTSWTHSIAHLIAKAVAGGAQAVIGGGDTIAAIEESGVPESDLGFLSTGGGAMLEYLLKGTLPGIEALK